MKIQGFILAVLVLCAGCSCPGSEGELQRPAVDAIQLPSARLYGNVSLEETLLMRRSVRQYADEPLVLSDISQLVWAAGGVTSAWGGRTAPSAGALYPINLYLAAERVEGIEPGLYMYVPDSHVLLPLVYGGVSGEIAEASLDQSCVREAPAILLLTAVYERTTSKYRERGMRYVHMEAGHIAQNICLQSVALGLGSVTVGAFDDGRLSECLGLPAGEYPLYVIPVGRILPGS